MNTLDLFAFDLGASNGRAILGKFDGSTISLQEVHRFENNLFQLNGIYQWNTYMQYLEMVKGFQICHASYSKNLASFGIDTWGVDYGLLDQNGHLLSNCRSYRNSTDLDVAATHACIDERTLYFRTGISSMSFNTIYQLHQRVRENDVALAHAKTLLFLPDLFAYFFTGEIASEYTVATTSALFDTRTATWDRDIIQKLGIPSIIFTDIQKSGSMRGRLLSSLAAENGIPQTPYAVVGSHDTASAVAAIPGIGNFAFCSSGTWSLFGVEASAPTISDTSFEAGLSNEGTVQGSCRTLKNIMGLWIIQECRRQWISQGLQLSWDDIVAQANAVSPHRSLINVEWHEFYDAGNMIEKIQEYCKNTNQPIPSSVGEIARCVYESLALKYRTAFEDLEEIRGVPLDSLNIVGGGCNNKLLNQFAANALGKPVIAGPVEGAAMGNLLMQAAALGELSGIDDIRSVVRNSVAMEFYEPKDHQSWEDAYHRLHQYP